MISYLMISLLTLPMTKKLWLRVCYDRARMVINMKENLAQEELYLHQVINTKGYSDVIIKAGSKKLPI